MVALRFLLGLAVLIFLVTFAIKNMEPQVTIEYYFGYSFGPLPFFFALLSAAVIGLVFASLYSAVEQIRLNSKIRQQTKRIASLEDELLDLKKVPPEPIVQQDPVHPAEGEG